jgi:hypothetical protein
MSDLVPHQESSLAENQPAFSPEIIVSENEDKLTFVRESDYFGGQLRVGCYLLTNKDGEAIVNVEGPIDRYDRRGIRTYATGVIVARINGQYVQVTKKELQLLGNVYGQVPQLRGRLPEVSDFLPGLSKTPETIATALRESQQASDMKMLPVTLQA